MFFHKTLFSFHFLPKQPYKKFANTQHKNCQSYDFNHVSKQAKIRPDIQCQGLSLDSLDITCNKHIAVNIKSTQSIKVRYPALPVLKTLRNKNKHEHQRWSSSKKE